MTIIRKMRKSDAPQVRKICLATADDSLKSTEKLEQSTLILYSDFYIRECTSHCFVATDENDKAVGYILCSPDYSQYKKSFKNIEMKKLRKLGIKYYFMGKGEMLSPRPHAKEYPAHLHIDILPEYQRQGLGHRLMNALIAQLKKDRIPGLILFVAPNNEKGINFYKKYGFIKLSNIAMGMKL